MKHSRFPHPGRLFILLSLFPLVLGGCVFLFPLYQMVEGRGPGEPVGVVYYRYAGETKAGEPYQVRYFLDPPAKRRYMVISIAGKVYNSGWEDYAEEIEAATRVYGPAWEGKSEEEIKARFGAPSVMTEAAEVRVWWYVRNPREVDALLFRAGRLLTAYRTNQAELNRLLAKPAPY